MEVKTEQEVFVEHISRQGLGVGEITGINYETGDALISVVWPNSTRGQYWAEELEFILGKKE